MPRRLPIEICVLGSVNLDLVASTSRLPRPGETVLGSEYHEYPGGKGLNQAVAAARAGAGTALCACVGDDPAGALLRDVARQAGVVVDQISVVAATATGRALIATSSVEAQNLIVVVPGANAYLTPDSTVRAVRGAHVVLAQLEIPVPPLIAAFRAAREQGAITILNPAPAGAATEELLSLTDFVIPNENETEELGGVEALLTAGVRHVIVTLGSSGVRFTSQSSEAAPTTEHVPALPVDAIDTTAAGDAFCGAFAAAISRQESILEAVRFGAAAGALATTTAGAVPSLPVRAEIDALIAGAFTWR